MIVVKQKDGSLKSTGFHVRFGKFQVLRCDGKVVRMIVNGHDTGIRMKLGHTGEAYFEEEVKENTFLCIKRIGSSRF